MFKQVEQIPRYRLVAEQIAELIISGKLERGSKMPPDRELVDKLGVSRATVREAIIALEISGFVENRFGAGAYISEHPPLSFMSSKHTVPGPFELLEARMIIEGEVAFIAATQIDDKSIEHLEYCIDCMRVENSEEFWADNADEEFHVTIARATHNTSLIASVKEFWRQRTHMPMWVKMQGRINVDDMRNQLIKEHIRIIQALKAKNSQAAREAMREHIKSFGKLLLEKWNTLDDDSRDSTNPSDDRFIRQLI